MTTPAANIQSVRRTCPKCGYIRETADTKCPDCRKTLVPVSRIRTLGVVSIVIGTFLLVFMGFLSFFIYYLITEPTRPGSTPKFTGGPKDIAFIAGVFGLVILIALVSIFGGLWQIIFGKRNRLIVFIMLGLGLLFLIAGLVVSMAR